MSFLGINIRKIRTVKKLSQNDFAKLFNLSRAAIGAYEEGRAEAKIDTVIQISEYFNISIDKLVKEKLKINDITKFEEKRKKINLKNKNLINYIEFENYKFLLSKNIENDNLKTIFLPFCTKEIIAVEYFSNKNKIVKNEFDNTILLCSKVKLGVDVLFSDKIYFFIEKENYYLGKITDYAEKFFIFDICIGKIEKQKSDVIYLFLVESIIVRNLKESYNVLNYNVLKKIILEK